MTVTQADVVRAAVELIDERGLAALTLRGVATRLGITAPTLYWHVRDKRHLLDLVAEQIAVDSQPREDQEPAAGQPVWEWLGERARWQRTALLAHRDSAQVAAGNRPTDAALPAIERLLATLVAAGLEPGEALRTVTALGSFIIGDTLETQTNADRVPPDAPPPSERFDGQYPTAMAAASTMGTDDDRFEEGLSLFLDGLRARLEARDRSSLRSAPS